MTGDYFFDLYQWLERDGYAIVTNFLRTYAIPDALNPATHLHRAPDTSSTIEALSQGAGFIEQEIIAAIEAEQIGFRDGWVSSHYLDVLIKQHRQEGRWPRNKRSLLMLDMGYKPHPGLLNGQASNAISPDGVRARLYIMCAGHPHEDAVGAEAMRHYTEAQTRGPAMMPGLRAVGT